MIKKTILFSAILLICNAFPQGTGTGYYNNSFFGQTSPGAMKFGLYGFDNPAILSTLTAPDFVFNWTDSWNNAPRYGLFAAIPNFGFTAVNEKSSGFSVTDYRLSFSAGDESSSFGAGYGWSKGDVLNFNRSNLWNIGFLTRPNRFLSIGAILIFPNTGEREGIVEAAFRPLQNEIISLFGDYVAKKNYISGEPKWSAGIAIEAFPGIRFTGRYFDKKSITAGIQLELGHMGISSQSYFDQNQKYAYNSYGIRFGGYDRNILTSLDKAKYYYSMNMINGIDHRKFKLFDTKMTLAGVLKNIDAAKNDSRVRGITINTSSMSGNREMLWEVREKLKDFKSTGKKVIVFIDRAGLNEYHFASIGDKIVMDPVGAIGFEGYIMGRMYLHGTMEKLGLGFDEFRFFKYKSALETYSRDKMREADREQRQRIIDDWYKLAKEDITQSRKLTGVQFDSLINNAMALMPEEALALGLVDTIARWDAIEKMVTDQNGGFISESNLENNALPRDNRWGPKPKIAVIYALGACAMDEGINARQLVKSVKSAVDDNTVKAIVLRVDSPGGDAMASDYISAVLKDAKGKKPIIVSQGFVAASGGYWLSMYSDTIVAAPSTITGSIGVIGGWLYNKGFKEMTGATTDFVKKGNHADLGFGMVLPLIDMPIPDRALTTEERSKVEVNIKHFYREFVKKVAEGRKKSAEYIATIAEGHVFSGYEGLQNGLVDVLGGLEKAIDIARVKANLNTRDYDIVQLPEEQLVDMNMFVPKLISAQIEESQVLKDLKFRLKYNGMPLSLLPMDFEY